MRINTGAAVPEGADSVVQVEDTKLIELSADAKTELVIDILKSPARGQDIRYVWVRVRFHSIGDKFAVRNFGKNIWPKLNKSICSLLSI